MRVFCISQHVLLAPCNLNCSSVSERRRLSQQSTRVNEGTLSALLMQSLSEDAASTSLKGGKWKKDIQLEFAFSFKSAYILWLSKLK